ncbi:MAG: TrkA family potassium uptake protein [Lawsonibacter sp.]|jgi:trk system potassium uptake protein TrkA|nr:TrkA family potassium uptake protein [Lawsonibacter sp.]MCI9368547.1 TrkA family potassium uptake protein [Oscillospiraceae bacterium]
MASTFLVIGLGRFGTNLALRLMDSGNEVLVIDSDEEAVSRIAPHVTQAKVGDCMDEEVLRSLDPSSFDFCFVCISENFQSSLETTSLLKEMGAPMVVAKADRDLHARLLLKIGADEVVFPERDMAQRTAVRFSVNGALEYIELAPGYAIFELDVPDDWAGSTLLDLDIRKRWNVNVIGRKEDGAILPIDAVKFVFAADTHILVAGRPDDINRMVKGK